jgi:carboxymethylenebutenolidase
MLSANLNLKIEQGQTAWKTNSTAKQRRLSSMYKTLKAADGHSFEAYFTGAQDAPRGLVVIQEIFGVNAHIREVCDGYAKEGFSVISPALFDRAEGTGSRLELGYDGEGMAKGMALVKKIGAIDAVLPDIEACLAQFPSDLPVSVVGYCWGGTLAWLSALRLPRTGSAVGYYGGGISNFLDTPPKCPIMLHFGSQDKHIALSDVDKIKAAYPDTPVFVYDADHGFNCDHRSSYNPEAARLARERSLEWIKNHP